MIFRSSTYPGPVVRDAEIRSLQYLGYRIAMWKLSAVMRVMIISPDTYQSYDQHNLQDYTRLYYETRQEIDAASYESISCISRRLQPGSSCSDEQSTPSYKQSTDNKDCAVSMSE